MKNFWFIANALICFLLVISKAEANSNSPLLFGFNLNRPIQYYPSVTFGTQRLWDSGVKWSQIETSPGVYDWSVLTAIVNQAQAHNIRLEYTFGSVPKFYSSHPNVPVCTVAGQGGCCNDGPGACFPPTDMSKLDNFAKALASKFKGKIEAYELWNEPENAPFWSGTVPQLVTLTKNLSNDIKSQDPNALIVAPAGEYTYMDKYWSSGGLQTYDVIATHSYSTTPEWLNAHFQHLREVLAKYPGVASKPIWSTEGGWGDDSLLPDPDMQMGLVARFFFLHVSNHIPRFYWYGWENQSFDTMWNPKGTNGCANAAGCDNQAGVAYQHTNNWLKDAAFTGPCSASGTVWTCNLTKPNGYVAQIVWDSAQKCSAGICTTSKYVPSSNFVQYHDLLGNVKLLPQPFLIGAKPLLLENKWYTP